MGAALPLTAIGFGALITLSDPEDWEGRSLTLAMSSFDNAPTVWGLVLVVCGVTLLCGMLADHPLLIWLGARLCGFWFMVAALLAFIRAVEVLDPIAGAVACTWVFFALNCWVNSQARVDHP